VKCYSMILCACGIDILLGIRNANKHFWRHCWGSNWLKISSNSLIKFTNLSLLILARLPLLSISSWFLQSSAGPVSIYHITSSQIWKLGKLWDAESSDLRRKFLGSSYENTSFNTHGSEDTPSILSPVQLSYPYWTDQWLRHR
jgi:hypothetical protein